MTLNLFNTTPTTTNTAPRTKATKTPTRYHRTGIYPRTLRDEIDYVCSACLAIVPDGITCRHCHRKKEQSKQHLENFLANKRSTPTTGGEHHETAHEENRSGESDGPPDRASLLPFSAESTDQRATDSRLVP